MLDYELLRLIWWGIIGVALIGFAVMDGFDLGVASLLPWVARNDIERRVVINTVGPVWEGNQVWLVLVAAGLFASWPYIYAVAFSGFYFAMLLLLVALILRPVAFKYRSKLVNPMWRIVWDWVLFTSGLVSSLVFGIAIGNVLQGIPFHFDQTLRVYYTGTFAQLINPFAVLCGVLAIVLFIMHGGAYLTIKTEKVIQQRAILATRWAAAAVICLFAIGGGWVTYLEGYVLAQAVDPSGPSNPLNKEVIKQAGAWLVNYHTYPWLWIAPGLGFIGALFSFFMAGRGTGKLVFLMSSLSVAGVVATVGLSMFPFILPSSTELASSLLVWDASSSQQTLFNMLIATLVFLPVIMLYTTWVYRVLRGKVTEQTIEKNEQTSY